jgi:hypothetical protein
MTFIKTRTLLSGLLVLATANGFAQKGTPKTPAAPPQKETPAQKTPAKDTASDATPSQA